MPQGKASSPNQLTLLADVVGGVSVTFPSPPARCAVAGRAGSHPGPAAAAGRQIRTASATTSAAIVAARGGRDPRATVARRPRLRREVGDFEACTTATLPPRRIVIKCVRGAHTVLVPFRRSR